MEPLVSLGDYLGFVLKDAPELLPNCAFELCLEAAYVILVESYFSHCFIEGEYQSVALLEDLGVANSQDIIENMGATELERIDFKVLVLNDLNELSNLLLVSFAPQLQLLLSEGHHFI